MRHPATLLPAGEGRRGDLLPAPSPEIFTAHTPVKRSTGASGSGSRISHPAAFGSFPALRATGAASDAKAPTFSLTRALPCSRATSPAFGPGLLSPRSPAGAPDRSVFSHRCGGVGCVLLSAAWRLHANTPARSDAAKASVQPKPARIRPWPALNPPWPSQQSRQYARAGLHVSPLSGAGIASRSVRGDINKSHALRCQPPSAAGGLHAYGSGYPGRAHPGGCRSGSPRSALTSSAMTADPRRADPGNLLAGAVAARLRPYHWPVALRGGGHIAGVV